MAWAVNNSGQMVCGPGGGENETTSASIYQIGTGALTPLTGLLFSYPKADGIPNYGGFQDCINSSGQVVGYELVGGVQHAAIWQNGNLIDLQAEYASILPSNFVLNNATAISDNGYIAGSGTDGSGNVMQAFLLQLMPGDANLNGRVDINDLTSVLTNYGKTAGTTWNAGDFNADGKVRHQRPDGRADKLWPQPCGVRCCRRRFRRARARHSGTGVRRGSARAAGLRPATPHVLLKRVVGVGRRLLQLFQRVASVVSCK